MCSDAPLNLVEIFLFSGEKKMCVCMWVQTFKRGESSGTDAVAPVAVVPATTPEATVQL